jgi:hypothetical protein
MLDRLHVVSRTSLKTNTHITGMEVYNISDLSNNGRKVNEAICRKQTWDACGGSKRH